MDDILEASPGELKISVGPGHHAVLLVDSARALKSLADCIMQHTALVPVSDLLVEDTLKLEAYLPSFGCGSKPNTAEFANGRLRKSTRAMATPWGFY